MPILLQPCNSVSTARGQMLFLILSTSRFASVRSIRSSSWLAMPSSLILLASLLFVIASNTQAALCFAPPGFAKPSNSERDGVQPFPNSADTVKLGSLIVPAVAVGTIAWEGNDELQKLVNLACQNNCAFFDTAERYGGRTFGRQTGFGWGETEKQMRKLLDEAQAQSTNTLPRRLGQSRVSTSRRPPVVCTKFTPTPWRTDAASVVRACKGSCERLGVEAIDLYQIHMPDIVQPLRFLRGDRPKDELLWEGLAECYLSGIARNVGVCNYGPTLLARARDALGRRGVPLASNQIAFSLLSRGQGAQATVDAGAALGVRTLAYFPLAMGVLTGKYSRDTQDDTGTAARRSPLELKDLRMYGVGGRGGWGDAAVADGGVRPLLAVMETIAAARRKTVAQVALNYVVCKGAIPIAGARTAQQLADNAGAMGWRLSAAEVSALERAAAGLGFEFDGAGFKRAREKFVGYGVEAWSLD